MRNAFNHWYVASIMPPEVPGAYQGWTPCVDWCKEHLGDLASSGWYFRGEGIFEFREKDDYLMFTLAWGK